MEKSVQYFSDEYLQQCKGMSIDQVLNFLESFRLLLIDPGALKQINLRVPIATLQAFKAKAGREGVPYQKKLKELMTKWALE